MLFGKLLRIEMVVIGKDKVYFCRRIADCHRKVSFIFEKRG